MASEQTTRRIQCHAVSSAVSDLVNV